MNEWSSVTVRDVVTEVASGPSPTCDERNASGDEWGLLKTSAVTWSGWNDRAHRVPPAEYWGQDRLVVRPNDVLITKAGPRNRVGVVVHVPETRPRLMVSGKMVLLRPDPKRIVPRFLADVLAASPAQKYLDDRTTGMTEAQTNFTKSSLLATPLLLPPLPEQRRIAEVLDTIDDTIRATDRLIEKLQSTLVGLTRRLIPAGHLAHLAVPQDLPDGWRFSSLEDLAINHDGRRVPIRAEDRLTRQGPYRYYGASGVIDHIDAYLFDGEFVLLGEDGQNVLYRSSPLAFIAKGQFWVNNHAHVFEARPGVDARFLSNVLERTDYAGVVLDSDQKKLTQAGLSYMRFPVTTLDVQTLVCNHLEAATDRVTEVHRYLAELQTLRSGLAADLLSGRVRTVAA